MALPERNERINKCILIATSIVFVLMEIHALTLDSHYKYDLVMTLMLLVFVFIIRKQIFIHWIHYLLFAFFLTAHNLGVYGLYDEYPLGIEYDYWVHGFFGFVSSLIIFRALTCREFTGSTNTLVFLTVIIVLGISAAHELYEYAGAMLLGQGEGVLFIGAGDIDEWDTQKDMLNNLIGSVAAIVMTLVYLFIKNKPVTK